MKNFFRWNKLIRIVDYPKTPCVFEKEYIDGRHVVVDRIAKGMEWVFDDGVRAVDKLHGSNHCISFDRDRNILAIDNRGNRIMESPQISINVSKSDARVIQGVLNAAQRGWFDNIDPWTGTTPARVGKVYGELIAPEINGNLHDVDRPYFVPFKKLADSCHWNSWVTNKYPKNFEALSEWFRYLPSLYSQKFHKKEVLAEGIIFLHPGGRVAKLRRNQFSWYYE